MVLTRGRGGVRYRPLAGRFMKTPVKVIRPANHRRGYVSGREKGEGAGGSLLMDGVGR